MPSPRDADDAELTAVTRALAVAIDAIDDATVRRPDIERLASAVAGCVQLTGLLAALTGSLGALAQNLTDDVPSPEISREVVTDLAAMRSLLHRATLVAAPAVADLRRCRLHPDVPVRR
jgi:hypothetical protein